MPTIQKILFGSPGTGKSFSIREIAEKELSLKWNEDTKTLENTIKTVFHPEYTYSDFVGKLLPRTTGNGLVTYKFYAGHFLQALGLAYKEIINGTNKSVLLVIDELNRGNAAAIFGSIFQLLDRDKDYWSSYEVNLSEIEILEILKFIGYELNIYDNKILVKNNEMNTFYEIDMFYEELLKEKKEPVPFSDDPKNVIRIIENLKKFKIVIPSNLSIIATINTSDESIYYLDSAFKRRWDWEYIDVPNSNSKIPEAIKDVKVIIQENNSSTYKEYSWSSLVINLNEFIKKQDSVRKIEDKQIGWWFLKADKDSVITESAIKHKLMFYLWDSVFSKDKKPLEKLLGVEKLITYADFANLSHKFIEKIEPQQHYTRLKNSNVTDFDDEMF